MKQFFAFSLTRRPIVARVFCLFFFFVSQNWLAAQSPDVLTYHNDLARTGQYLAETLLTPASVNSNQFGKLWILPTDAETLAEPLYASGVFIPNVGPRNVLFIETENDSAYGFDADSTDLLWQTSLLEVGELPFQTNFCTITPQIGVTATPVIDRQFGAHGAIFIEAMSQDSNGNAHHRLHALDLATGQELLPPAEISATYPGIGDESDGFNDIYQPADYVDRASLMLLNGVVYTFWSAHCNARPATSWVIGYYENSLTQSSVINLEPNSYWGSIWNSGAGPSADANGNIYVALGDGAYQDFTTPLDTNGFPSDQDYGNSLVKLSTANQTLAVADYFAMSNVVYENAQDWDLGSGAPVVLPDMIDAQGNVRQLVSIAGKDENIYVADRSNLGKFNANNNNALYQEILNVFTGTNNTPPDAHGMSGGVWSIAAYFNGTLYFGPVRGPITAFPFQNARLGPSTSHSPTIYGYPGAEPSISASGASNGIVWTVETVGKGGFEGLPTKAAILHAYSATNLANEIYNSNQATNSRDKFGNVTDFVTPMIANGRVYVASTAGIGVFGMLMDTVTVAASPTEGGTVSGAGTFTAGQQATATATPANGYAFSDWTINGIEVSLSSNYTHLVDSNETLVANFLPPNTIAVDPSPINGGTVSGAGTFAPGSTNTVTAIPAAGYVFSGWTLNGTNVSENSNYSFPLQSSVTLVANFTADSRISIFAVPSLGGTVNAGGVVPPGTMVNLTATANPGYLFSYWAQGDTVVSTSPYFTFEATGDETFSAIFTPFTTGHVYCSCDASGIAGATVQAGDYSTTTDENGAYTLPLPAGSYTATITPCNPNLYAPESVSLLVPSAPPANDFYLNNLTLMIDPIYDWSILQAPNAQAITNSIAQALRVYPRDLANPLCVSIYFDALNGDPADVGAEQSDVPTANISYNRYFTDLQNRTTESANSAIALENMPSPPNTGLNGNSCVTLTAGILLALGETCPAQNIFENYSYFGTVSLNVAYLNACRPDQNPDFYDLQTVVLHGVNEVLGIGSSGSTLQLGGAFAGDPSPTTGVGPLDLFRFTAPGVSSFSLDNTMASYFSIDGGETKLTYFNQFGQGTDFGDWGDGVAPADGQPNKPPQVQDAFFSPGAMVDLGANELIALDVIGYTLAPSPPKLYNAAISAHTISFSWPTLPGIAYQVQYTSNLREAWTNLGDPIIATGTTSSTSTTDASATEQFYRVVTVPQ